jgi:hypothetical protein
LYRTRERVATAATLSEFQGDGPVRDRPNQMVCFTKGLPLENTPSDCPDTSLQYHSRHWITSFQKIADTGIITQILCLSKQITQPLW